MIARTDSHQIRVHLNSIGLPVLGDPDYGRRPRRDLDLGRPFLHSHTLSFDHPISGGRVEVTAELPRELQQALEGCA